MSTVESTRNYLYSDLGADPDLGEVVTMFVSEMPNRIATLQSQWETKNWEELRRTAHQLKGAAGSYGFEPVSPCAGKLEYSLRDGDPEEVIAAEVQDLIDMCGRIRSGEPPK